MSAALTNKVLLELQNWTTTDFAFGNNEAFVLSEGSVKWVIPECQSDE